MNFNSLINSQKRQFAKNFTQNNIDKLKLLIRQFNTNFTETKDQNQMQFRGLNNNKYTQYLNNITNSQEFPQICELFQAYDPHIYNIQQPTRQILYNDPEFQLIYIYLKKDQQVAIHEHSQMVVFFKLLQGQIQYTSFDKLVQTPITIRDHNTNIQKNKVIKVVKYPSQIIKPQEIQLITPFNRNLHGFKVLTDTILLDLAIPGYLDLSSLNGYLNPNQFVERFIVYYKEVSNPFQTCQSNISNKLTEKKETQEECLLQYQKQQLIKLN